MDRFEIRDIDSRLGHRDRDAIYEWVASGKTFHILRDHPSTPNSETWPGCGGGTKQAIPNILELLTAQRVGRQYGSDQRWLREKIWPLTRESSVQHDAFSCNSKPYSLYSGGQPFPSKRDYPTQHIGSVHLRRGAVEQSGDAAVVADWIASGRQPAACKDRKSVV